MDIRFRYLFTSEEIELNVKFLILALIFLLLVSCTSYEASAPVEDINVHLVGKFLVHRVQPGETLYSIAWRYDKDYRVLAAMNKLKTPYSIHPGEDIRLNGSSYQKSMLKLAPSPSLPVTPPFRVVNQWYWPTIGRVVHRYSKNYKGIDIAGIYGQSVRATAAGKVVYAGDGIRGYGNLLLIQHDSRYLTAYAYNSSLLVKEGEWVKADQKIARMGKTLSGRILLHFEIRKIGKPVDPLKYLSHNA